MIIKRIMNMMVNSCKKTTELIDKKQVVSLSAKEKMQLQLHKTMCNTCNAYEKQSKLMDTIIGKWFTSGSESRLKFSEERKTKIITAINKL